jgi:F0F1-type ATP synthase assembly protein I
MVERHSIFEEEKSPTEGETFEAEKQKGFYQTPFIPEKPEETVRRSGLAYAAVAALVGSVVFMLFLGWLIDSFFGTAPYFLVGGIVLGSIIGFLQFFRVTAQIISK